MIREQVLQLLKKSIEEQIKLSDYSTIYYKITIADNYTEGGVFNSVNDAPNANYLISYPDSLEFFRLYNGAIATDEKFNNIEIRFDKDMNTKTVFSWDQAFYDADIEANKKYTKKKK